MTINVDLKIIPDVLWSDKETQKPTFYVANGHIILVKQEYLNQIDKRNPLSYTWIVHEYGSHVYHVHCGQNSDIDFSFPDNRYSRFAFAYQFEYLKKRGYRDLMQLKSDKYLMHLYLEHPIVKNYFQNSNFILSCPESNI